MLACCTQTQNIENVRSNNKDRKKLKEDQAWCCNQQQDGQNYHGDR